MSISTRTFALWLAMTPGVGGRTVTRILARNELLDRSPELFMSLSLEALREEYNVKPSVAQSLLNSPEASMDEVQALERRLDGLGVSLVTAADAHYPVLVEEMDPDPPGVLFLYGNSRLLDSSTFCVLASRNTLPADLELIESLAEEGVLRSQVVVSGHDRPEYQRSAIVPLRWGAPRILCLDRGLFTVLGQELKDEAFRAARLWRYQFDPSTDLVVSPFRPYSDFIGVNNRVRDRLVACLSRNLDFVNVAPGGNMDRLIRLALKAGRKVRISDRVVGYRGYLDLGAELIKT